MTQVYGDELRKQIEMEKAHTIEIMQERAARISRMETDEDDCFMSQRIDQSALSEYDTQLHILDGDGMMEIDAVVDQDGNEIWVHWVHTRYGGAWVGRGVFASSIKALLKKTGWKTETKRVPVWTKFVPSGSGLMGVYGGSYQEVRWHTNMKTGEYVGYPD